MLKKETPKRRSRKRPVEPKSKLNKDKIMALAGIWSDIDADELIERIYRWRHEAPPSPPPGE